MFEKALQAIRGLPPSAQWLLLSVGKAFGGSVILAFAANYATAYFAIRHGFRVPLEGVPYLSFAVGIAGFATFLLAMPFFLLFVFLAQYTRHAILVRGLTKRQTRIFGYIVAAMLGLLFALNMAWFLNAEFARGLLRYFLPPTFPEERVSLVAGGLMAAAFFSLMAMWTVGKGFGWIGAQLQAWLIVLIVMFCGLFWYDCYGSFLRLIRYGGGIEVTIQGPGPSAAGGEKTIYRRKLLWMTESHVVLFDSAMNVIEEIPRSQVSSIVYIPTPDWGLPERVLERQPAYIRIETQTGLGQAASVQGPPR
jgi:hypothetical protein